jgi:hypothetical protein
MVILFFIWLYGPLSLHLFTSRIFISASASFNHLNSMSAFWFSVYYFCHTGIFHSDVSQPFQSLVFISVCSNALCIRHHFKPHVATSAVMYCNLLEVI